MGDSLRTNSQPAGDLAFDAEHVKALRQQAEPGFEEATDSQVRHLLRFAAAIVLLVVNYLSLSCVDVRFKQPAWLSELPEFSFITLLSARATSRPQDSG